MVNLNDYNFKELLSNREIARYIINNCREHYLNFNGMDVSVTDDNRVFILRSHNAEMRYQEVPYGDWKEFELREILRTKKAEFFNGDNAFWRTQTGEYMKCHLPSETYSRVSAEEYAAEKGLSNEICKTTTRSILTDEEVEKLEKNN